MKSGVPGCTPQPRAGSGCAHKACIPFSRADPRGHQGSLCLLSELVCSVRLPGFACCIKVDLCLHKWFILFCDPFISVGLVLVSPLLLLILTNHTFLLLWLQRTPFVHLPKHPSFGFIHFLSWLFYSRGYYFILALESCSFCSFFCLFWVYLPPLFFVP